MDGTWLPWDLKLPLKVFYSIMIDVLWKLMKKNNRYKRASIFFLNTTERIKVREMNNK